VEKKIKCPCEDCICIAVCRNKRYIDLIYTCSYWKKYVNFDGVLTDPKMMKEHRKKFLEFEKILKPKRWSTGQRDDAVGFKINNKY